MRCFNCCAKRPVECIRRVACASNKVMKRVVTIACFSAALIYGSSAFAQEGPQPTEMVVSVESKSMPPTDASALTVEVNGRKEPLTSWEALAPNNAQVALLIDDGLRESIGRELDNLKSFVGNLPSGVEVMIGFMQLGHVVAEQDFTADHSRAANSIHLPQGVPGASASPYLCLSDFVQHWPGAKSETIGLAAQQRKARIVLMLTNGVDPYNGSTSVLNQDSPYVKAAVTDAQRAGVAVYSIYFGDAGIRGASADNSGQSYLAQLTEATGGVNYWEGVGNPVSLKPFLDQFQQSLAETYIAGFLAPAGHNPQRDLVHVKISAPHVKLHSASQVLPGNRE